MAGQCRPVNKGRIMSYKKCDTCGEEFAPTTKTESYCSYNCFLCAEEGKRESEKVQIDHNKGEAMKREKLEHLQTNVIKMGDYVWVESILALLKYTSSAKYTEVEHEEKEVVLKLMGVEQP